MYRRGFVESCSADVTRTVIFWPRFGVASDGLIPKAFIVNATAWLTVAASSVAVTTDV